MHYRGTDNTSLTVIYVYDLTILTKTSNTQYKSNFISLNLYHFYFFYSQRIFNKSQGRLHTEMGSPTNGMYNKVISYRACKVNDPKIGYINSEYALSVTS